MGPDFKIELNQMNSDCEMETVDLFVSHTSTRKEGRHK